MKSNLKKLLIVTITVVICAFLTVAGLAVSAASHHNAALESIESSIPEALDISTPALQDGVWLAKYHNGSSHYFVIDNKEASFSILDTEKGIGVPSRFEYDKSIGMYKLHIGSAENTENWRVIDNDGSTAVVKDANGDLITLSFLCEDADAYFND